MVLERSWMILLVAVVVAGPGCASGGTVDPRGGDGGARAEDGATRDASADGGGGSPDAAAPGTDAAAPGTDAAAPGTDAAAPGTDAAAPGTDAGPRDGGCPPGAMMSCTSSCGTLGTSTCASGAWSACAPPAESCNDADDDCDGMIDDGFACRRSTSGSCTTSCGSTGSRTCSGSCAWGTCAAPAETCDGADQDCDGTVDEGFRAAVLRVSYLSDLAPLHGPCNGSTQRIGADCNAAMHRYCAARACSTSGFGPDESAGDAADVTCVVADVRSTTFAVLSGHHAGCIASAGWGPDCNAAVHRYCGAQGFPSGFGPVEQASGNASVACVRSAMVIATSYTVLAGHHAGCNGSTQRMGPECNAAIHRHCAASGYVSGYGPVENAGDTAYVACVRL